MVSVDAVIGKYELACGQCHMQCVQDAAVAQGRNKTLPNMPLESDHVKDSLILAGCFADKFAPDRAMTLLQASDTMTVDTCANLANSQGYTTIGVQYAKECWAGANVSLATRWGAATNCDSPCYSDPANTCGGGLANSIYLLPSAEATVLFPSSTPPPAVVDPPVAPPAPVLPPVPAGQLSSLNITPLGCYADAFAQRALPAQLKVSTTMTVNECAQLAWSNPGEGCSLSWPSLLGELQERFWNQLLTVTQAGRMLLSVHSAIVQLLKTNLLLCVALQRVTLSSVYSMGRR